MSNAGRRRKVLVADDETDVRETLAEYLRAHGFDTLEAANGLPSSEESR